MDYNLQTSRTQSITLISSMSDLTPETRRIWYALREFETHDITTRHYYARHSEELAAGKAREISSNFKQAGEYFRSAADADFSVRPLLQYYGVLTLSRGIILFLDAQKRENEMHHSHGLSTLNWKQELKGGLAGVGKLTTKLTKGTFYDLLIATKGKFYFRLGSAAVNCLIVVNIPKEGSEFTFKEIASRIPNASEQNQAWTGNLFPSIYVHSFEADICKNLCKYLVPIASETQVDTVFPVDKFPGRTVTNAGNYIQVSCGLQNMPFWAQNKGLLNIGSVVLYSPLDSDLCFSPLATCFMSSFTFGMLCRYFPTSWINISRSEKGDSVYPLVTSLLDWIQDAFPAMIVDILRGPYEFE